MLNREERTIGIRPLPVVKGLVLLQLVPKHKRGRMQKSTGDPLVGVSVSL